MDKIYTREELINELYPHDNYCVEKKKELEEKFNSTYSKGQCLCSVETIVGRGKIHFAMDETLRAVRLKDHINEAVDAYQYQIAVMDQNIKIKTFNGDKG